MWIVCPWRRGPLCYHYFAFSNRSKLSNWDFSQEVTASWEGITVNSQGRVTKIDLSLGLAGFIAPELGKLSSLKELDLCLNELSGGIPPELFKFLSSLESLFLSSNKLSGGISPELGKLSSLKELDLRRNELSGGIPPELFKFLSSLESLLLSSNNFSGMIPKDR